MRISVDSKKGVVLLVVIVLMSAIFAISLGIFRVVFGELLITGEISDSTFAFYTADEGIERTLYRDLVKEEELCPSLGSPCHTETAIPAQSGGCYDLEMSKTPSGPLILTRVAVTGQYRCGTDAVRVVKRAFDLAYWGVAPVPSPFSPDTTGDLGEGLAAYWKLDETSGTRSDSVASNHLTDNNTVTVNAGIRGNAAQFTAANSEFLSIADNPSVSSGNVNFTIASWVRFDDVVNEHTIVAKDSDSPGGREYLLYRNPSAAGDTMVRFLIFDGSNPAWVFSNENLLSNTWYFVVVWRDASAGTLNIQVNNGSVASVGTGVTPADTTTAFNVGRRTGGSAFMNGRIDEVGLWKRVLMDQERTDLYNGGSGNTYTAP